MPRPVAWRHLLPGREREWSEASLWDSSHGSQWESAYDRHDPGILKPHPRGLLGDLRWSIDWNSSRLSDGRSRRQIKCHEPATSAPSSIPRFCDRVVSSDLFQSEQIRWTNWNDGRTSAFIIHVGTNGNLLIDPQMTIAFSMRVTTYREKKHANPCKRNTSVNALIRGRRPPIACGRKESVYMSRLHLLLRWSFLIDRGDFLLDREMRLTRDHKWPPLCNYLQCKFCM